MATTQYIGARYVPVIYGAWVEGVQYEPLTIVTYLNQSYTSKKPVPATVGNPADNDAYWALTGAYNAQVAQLASDVSDARDDISTLQGNVTDLQGNVTDLQGNVTDLQGNVTDLQGDVNLLKYKIYTIRADGVKTDGQILDEWYTEHRTELNAIDFQKKRNMLMDTPSGTLRIAAIGSIVLEFYGIIAMPDTMANITFYAVKLAQNGSKVLRYRCDVTQNPATWTTEDLSSTVRAAGPVYNLMVM